MHALLKIFKTVLYAALFLGLYLLADKYGLFSKFSSPTRFVVTADTKIIPGSELSKYVTQEEIDDFAFRYWDIDKQIKDDAFAENFRKLLKSKQTDQILKFMQDNNISIDSPLIDGVTPLMYASFYDDEATAKRLIDMGANAHAQDNYKLSPLAYAIENNSTKTAKLLLDSGVKFSNKEKIQRYLKAPQNDRIKSLTIDGDNIFVEYEAKYGQKNEGSKGWILPFDYITFGNFTEMLQILFSMGYFDENGNYFKDMEYMPNYEPMLNLLLDNNVSGQPTKEELKEAYEKCYKSYRWHVDTWKKEIDKNHTIPLLIRMSIENGERYCPDKDGAFGDTRTFMYWANEKNKLKNMINFWDGLKNNPSKVIYIDANISDQDKEKLISNKLIQKLSSKNAAERR